MKSPRTCAILSLLVLAALGGACPTGSPTGVTSGATRRPGTAMQQHVEVQGHRGCRGLRPENTLAAFRHAITLGVDVLELDLALTRDDALVVAHDPHVNAARCAGAASLLARRFRDLTLAEVQRLDCGGRRNPRFPEQQLAPGERIPRLEQVLDLLDAHPGLRANAEIKTFPAHPEWTRPPTDFARALVELLRRRAMLQRVIVQSFDAAALQAVARLAPEIVRAALVERRDEIEPLLAATSAPIVSPRYSELQPGDVARLRARGLRVIPWTVNAVADMRRLIAWGVDGIITDRPDLLLALLGRTTPP